MPVMIEGPRHRVHRGSPWLDPDANPETSRGTPHTEFGAAARSSTAHARTDSRNRREINVRSPARSPANHRPSPTSASRLSRRSDGKLIAGVASGVGEHFNIEPNLVRLGFIVLALAGGAGVVLYLAGWLWLPEDRRRRRAARPIGRQPRSPAVRLGADRRARRGGARGVAAVAVDRAAGARPGRVAARPRRHGHRVDRRSQRASPSTS